MRLSHSWAVDRAVFDDENLVSCAGLIPVMALAEQACLSELLDDHVRFTDERIRSGGANPAGKLTSIIAGLAAGADSIDDLQVVRSGGMKRCSPRCTRRRRWGFIFGSSPTAMFGNSTPC